MHHLAGLYVRAARRLCASERCLAHRHSPTSIPKQPSVQQPRTYANCLQCIKSWIENKRASGVPVSCPVCRQASSALLYNCAGEPHDHWNLTAPGPAPTSTPRDSGLPQPGDAAPSEIADRRRAYTLPAACVIAACEHAALTGRQLSAAPRAESGRASTAQGAQQGGASSCEQAPHIVVRQDIHGAECRAWLRRELRALLHCPEPDIAEAVRSNMTLEIACEHMSGRLQRPSKPPPWFESAAVPTLT